VPPVAAVTYRPGGPIDSVRVFAFAADDAGQLTLCVDPAPKGTGPVAMRRTVAGKMGGDYGYLLPLEFTAEFKGDRPKALTLSAGATPIQISRIEIRYDGR
jgi:hypothetical protein